jgi:hypothetical protein
MKSAIVHQLGFSSRSISSDQRLVLEQPSLLQKKKKKKQRKKKLHIAKHRLKNSNNKFNVWGC